MKTVRIAAALALLSACSPGSDSSADRSTPTGTATSNSGTPPQPTTYALRSSVPGASFVRLGQLPTVTPYGDNSDAYCGERVRATTTGGQLAERRGWRVVREVRFHGLEAVLVVRGYDPGTSSHCFSKDPNLALFDGDRLVGVLYSTGTDGIGMNDVEHVGDHLRVWDDNSPVGQINLNGTNLTFDRVMGNDEVCDGRYRVPAVFGRRYSRARLILSSSGWIVRPSTEETSEGDRTEEYRTRFPEADSCSGTGYAYCRFSLSARHGVASLFITTTGEDDDPVVTSYRISCDGRQDQ